MQVLRVIGIILEIIILFNFIILIHELGHFLAARWRGLKVEKFQIWFGKPIWSKTVGGVQYGLGWIPAGGFVALPQMAPMPMLEGTAAEEPSASIKPIDKIIVAAAGPLFSFGLALVFAFIVWGIGHPVSKAAATTVVGVVDGKIEGPNAIQPGDQVLEVDGKPVRSWLGMVDSVQWSVITSQADVIPFKIKRPGVDEPFVVEVKAPNVNVPREADKKGIVGRFFTRPELRDVGTLGFGPAIQPMVGKVYEKSPADEAGIRVSDVISRVNGAEARSYADIGKAIQASPDLSADLVLLRREGSRDVEIPVKVTARVPDNMRDDYLRSIAQLGAMAPVAFMGNVPLSLAASSVVKRMGEVMPRPLIGVVWDFTGRTALKWPKPTEQIRDAVQTMYNTLTSVFSPKSNISAKHLAGPVGIMRVYYILFEDANGWRRAFWFSVLLNINLGIMNLLPLPVLDGGHITMAVLEWIRKRPISTRLLEFVQAGCALLLIGFMIYITGFDVGELFGRKNPGKEGVRGVEPQFYTSTPQ